MKNKPVFDYPLFAMGFRVFFGLAGLSALALIAIWNTIHQGTLHLENYYPIPIWHAHEMMLGFATAVIAGLLLSTGSGVSYPSALPPDQLAGLSLLWLYGRIAPFYAKLLPDILIAGLDLAFLPLLIFYLTQPMLKKNEFKSLAYLLVLVLMLVANFSIHAQILGFIPNTAQTGLYLLLAVFVSLVIFVSDRTVPNFIERSFSGAICMRNPVAEQLTNIISLVVFLLWLLDIGAITTTFFAIIAIALHLHRLYNWYDKRIWYVPLLWVLFIGYSWIILGFGLLVLAVNQLIPLNLVFHAFGLGGIGLISLGIMARIALQHTGRPLSVSNLLALMFLLINLAAVSLVLFPAILPAWYASFVWFSSYSWLAGFSLFIFYYLPILTRARKDGNSG